MIYVTADIHGDLRKYNKLLNTIKLTPRDALVVLGDVLDRGANGITILQDIMEQANVFMMMGNHEQIALACLNELNKEITEKSIEDLQADTTDMLVDWIYNLGGESTLDEFAKLSSEEKEDILDFIAELPLYEEFTINNQAYLLVHGGLKNFSPTKDIQEYTEDDILWDRIDYNTKYYDDKIIITGHTPTRNIKKNQNPDCIYKANNHIAIDCGCGFTSGRLGCICLNTMQEFYI